MVWHMDSVRTPCCAAELKPGSMELVACVDCGLVYHEWTLKGWWSKNEVQFQSILEQRKVSK